MRRTAPADGTPWHLLPVEMREYFCDRLDCSYDHPNMTRIGESAAKAREAALAVLYAAAPYPDDALAFEMHTDFACRVEVEIVDVIEHGSLLVRDIATGDQFSTFWACLSPLTIAAHEALIGGVR